MMFAQGTGGRILGRVADPSGAVLAGVKVTLTNEATGVSHESTTKARVTMASHRFRWAPIAGIRLAGFKKNVRAGVNVDLNQVIT